MREKRTMLHPNNIWTSKDINISFESNDYYFEIGDHVTTDISEAVSLMIRLTDWDDNLWNTKIKDINLYNTIPKNALYWMSGGDEEWMIEDNYIKSWNECCSEYQEEFGIPIMNILEKSETLKDVRDGFIKQLSLEILYEFALSRGIS